MFLLLSWRDTAMWAPLFSPGLIISVSFCLASGPVIPILCRSKLRFRRLTNGTLTHIESWMPLHSDCPCKMAKDEGMSPGRRRKKEEHRV